jgi:succinate dehydrogenase/fumarate reductase flavoprotein subunit
MTTKIMDCDLVILGAGGSGLFAAVKAYDLTGRKVIVLEKAKKPGGATYFAGGLGTVKDSKWQKDAGYEVSEPQHISGQVFDWLVSKGGAESFYKVAKPGENARSAISEPGRTEKYKDLPDPSIGPGRGGTFIVDKMVECCQKTGIQILYETPARKFITGHDGKVAGVLADAKDGQLLVNCKACVIAAGGFGRNYEKLQKHWPEEYNNKEIFFLCPPGMMGDGIDMAEEIGAYIDQTKWPIGHAVGSFATAPIHHPYSFSLMTLTESGMFISVNLNGKRWKNESVYFGGVSVGTQPGGVAYAVGDDEIIEAAGSQRARQGMGGQGNTGGASESHESRVMKKWREDLEYEAAIDEEGASGNHVKKANTLVELALKMKIDPAVFVETIERYNRFCEAGKDLDFGKQAQSLKAIKKPPFWAVYGHRFSQCTKGANGVAVNSRFEVLNKRGETIPGLYAVGDGCTIYGGKPEGIAGGGPEGSGADTAGTPGGASGGPAAEGRGAGPGSAPAARVNILTTEPYPCNGSSAALISGYYAALGVADYFKNS